MSLLSQTLREWTAESDINFHNIAVCSDVKVGKIYLRLSALNIIIVRNG